MKILLVVQYYRPSVGGIETHARRLAHELARRHAVRVAAVNFAPSRLPRPLAVLHTDLLAPSYRSYCEGEVSVDALTPAWSDRLRLSPIALRAVPRLRRYAYHALHRFGYRCYRPVFLPRLRQSMQGVDVVHALAGGYLGWAAQAAANELGIPFVCTPFVHPKQWGDDPANIAYYKRCDAVVALLPSDRRYLLSLGIPADKLHVIGVSPDLLPTRQPELFRKQHGLGSAPVVLYLGRMAQQKGAKALLEAAEKVWQSVPDARFVFMGPPARESERWFENADFRILYVGEVSPQEKTNALAACDIFCMPSQSEILPTVYLEAWICGKPVVGGRAPGLAELIGANRAGIAVGQDPVEISATLVQLLQDAELRTMLGRRGEELVKKRYSVEAVTSALESLYRQVMGASEAGVLS